MDSDRAKDKVNEGRRNKWREGEEGTTCSCHTLKYEAKVAQQNIRLKDSLFGGDVGCAKPFVANKRPSVFHGKHAEPFLLDTAARAKSSLIQFGYKLW